jgi:hypothetical protein
VPAPGVDVSIVDDAAARSTAGVVVHRANGSSSVLPNPDQPGQVLKSTAGDPSWALAGVPVFVQATQPTGAPVPSLWIPLDGSGNPLPPTQWQVFA